LRVLADEDRDAVVKADDDRRGKYSPGAHASYTQQNRRTPAIILHINRP